MSLPSLLVCHGSTSVFTIMTIYQQNVFELLSHGVIITSNNHNKLCTDSMERLTQ